MKFEGLAGGLPGEIDWVKCRMNQPEAFSSEPGGYARYMRQFRAMLAVQAKGSTARAAEILPLSQSAIARAVRELESALEVELFERVVRGMLPTREGQILAYRAHRAFEQINAIDHDMSRIGVLERPAMANGYTRLAMGCSYRHLVTYVALCATRSETLAAQHLNVSQPAVNQTLRQLEYMAGARLFQRSPHGMRLLESGEIVFRRFKLALDEFRRAAEDLEERRGSVRSHLRVGTLPLAAGSWVPTAVGKVLARHPEMSATVVDGTYEALLDQLLHADIDVIVGALRPRRPDSDVKQELLIEDNLAVVARGGHPLQGKSLQGLKELAHYEWISPLSGSPARDAFERAFHAAGVAPPHSRIEANNMTVLLALLTDSDRLALLSPYLAIRAISSGFLQVLPVALEQTTRHIGLTVRASADPGVGLKSFMAEMRALAEARRTR